MTATTLVVAEHRRGALRDVTLELVSAARALGGPVTVALLGKDVRGLVPGVDVGVDEIVVVPLPTEEFDADCYRTAVESLIAERRPAVVLTGFTVDAMGYAPAVAARLGLGFASDVVATRREDDALVADRSLFGGKLHAELEFPGLEQVLLQLRPGTWSAAAGAPGATVTELPAPDVAPRGRHAGFVEPVAADIDLSKAEFLLSIGRGVDDESSVPDFERLAGKMGAVLAASRPLVDAGWLPHAHQVGQSGATVKPKIYLALGISGAVQHLAGMRGSDTIIAVNTDPDAAVFGVAHYGAVADLFEVAEELEKLY